MPAASVQLDAASCLRLAGAWTLLHAPALHAQLQRLAAQRVERIDASALERIDTSGALLLAQMLQRWGLDPTALEAAGMKPDAAALVRLVAERRDEPVPEAPRSRGIVDLLERTGRALARQWTQSRELLGFVGRTFVTLGQIGLGRRKLRLTSIVFHMEQTGLDAVPIVTLLSFLVGAVVAFLGAAVLADFGAQVFTVELVSYSFLREFGVLLTAILLAGRSGSAFTAQIGSMKSREELDAIGALGLDPVELLVVPRLIALLLMLPLLAFLAMLAGLIGGGLVGALALDITPGMFLSRLYEMTDVRHFWVGMIKAPVFAFLIAVVGCLEGFKVEGSAESVGRHTTSSVVQAIFLVILFDAVFAIFFRELGV